MGFFKDVTNAFSNFINLFAGEDMFGQRVDEMKEIQLRRNYREGRQRDQLNVMLNGPNDNVKRNIIGKAIAQSMHLLLGQGVDFDLPGDDGTPEDQWLKACWEANKKNLLLKDVFYNAADGRCGFVKINPTAKVMGWLDITDDGIDRRELVEFPKLENINPLYMTMDSLPHDIDMVIRYTVQYVIEVGGVKKLFKQITENEVEGDGENLQSYWMIRDYEKDLDTGLEFELVNEVRWDYDFAPIIHFKNLPNPNDLWGMPDATEDVLELQDKLNFNLSNLNKIIRYHAHPRTVGKGVGEADQLDVSPDKMILLKNPDADIWNLEMQSDLAGALEVMDYIGKSILDGMDSVNLSNLKDKIGQITNFAIRVLFYDALGKMQVKREIWEAWLLDLNRRLLTVAEREFNPDPGKIVWPKAVLPTDEVEVIDVQIKEIDSGLKSRQTIALERGVDWEQESERIEGEKVQNENVGNLLVNEFFRGGGNEV